MENVFEASRSVAFAVKEALTNAGMSQRQASERTGIPMTTLVRRLTGNSPFLVTELAALASVAGTTPTALIQAAEEHSNTGGRGAA